MSSLKSVVEIFFYVLLVMPCSDGLTNPAANVIFTLNELSVIAPNSLTAMAGLNKDACQWQWPYVETKISLVASRGSERCPIASFPVVFSSTNSNYSTFRGEATANCTFDSLEGLSFYADIDGNATCAGAGISQLLKICHDQHGAPISTNQDGNLYATPLCQNNFTATYAKEITCLEKNIYGDKCDVYCVPYYGLDYCYDCNQNGSKRCCNDLFQGQNCTAIGLTTIPSIPKGEISKSQDIWWILTIVFASLVLLLLLLLFCVIILYLKAKKKQQYDRRIYPGSKQDTKKTIYSQKPVVMPAQHNSFDSTTNSNPQHVQKIPVDYSTNKNGHDIRKFIINPDHVVQVASDKEPVQIYQRPDPVYSIIRKEASPVRDREETSVSSIGMPSKDDFRRRPIVGTPDGFLTSRRNVTSSPGRTKQTHQSQSSSGNESDDEEEPQVPFARRVIQV